MCVFVSMTEQNHLYVVVLQPITVAIAHLREKMNTVMFIKKLTLISCCVLFQFNTFSARDLSRYAVAKPIWFFILIFQFQNLFCS